MIGLPPQADEHKQDTPEPQRLSADDLIHHTYLLRERMSAEAAMSSWGKFLVEKYNLSPYHGVAEDGTILTPEEVQQRASTQ